MLFPGDVLCVEGEDVVCDSEAEIVGDVVVAQRECERQQLVGLKVRFGLVHFEWKRSSECAHALLPEGDCSHVVGGACSLGGSRVHGSVHGCTLFLVWQ